MRDIEKYFPAQRRDVLSGSEATPAAYLSSKPEKYAYLHLSRMEQPAARARSNPPSFSAKTKTTILTSSTREISSSAASPLISSPFQPATERAPARIPAKDSSAYPGRFCAPALTTSSAHSGKSAMHSTPQLMDTLYDGLSHGEDPASALRAAKLSLLHSDSVFRKPYYWAPFQLYAGS